MPLTKPALTSAEPGSPITAQGWNEIVDGLSDLYDAVLALGSALVTVDVLVDGQPLAGARVVAQPLGETGFEMSAIPPIGTRTSYLLSGLKPGDWRIRVEATGLTAQQRDITVPRDEPLVVDMEASGPVVGDLFGLGAQNAVNALADAGVTNDRVRIIDTSGQEVSPHDMAPEHRNSEVLVQVPAGGTVLADSAATVRLVVAAPLVETESVTMPSLKGLSYDEVVETLGNLGLKIGKTIVKSS